MRDEAVRYRLDQGQVSAVFRLLGVVPNGRFVTVSESDAIPRDVLEGSGLLDTSTGLPVPVLGTAMRILAAPERVLVARVNVRGVAEWDVTHLVSRSTGGPYVAVATPDTDLDLLVLPTEYEVAALLDGLFDLTTLPSRPVAPDVVVSFDGWIGVLAAADAQRSAELAAQLDRRPAPDARFDAGELHKQLASGTTGDDTRWAVTAFTPISPFELRAAPPSGSAMMEGLKEADLVEVDGADTRLSDLGWDVTQLCSDAIKWGSVTLSSTASSPDVRMAEVTVVRTPLRLGLGFWNGEDESREVTLLEPESEVAVEMIRRLLLIPVPSPEEVGSASSCPSCGAPVEPGQRFCARCGSSLEPAAAPKELACPSCGVDVDLNQGAFCWSCGAAVGSPPNGGDAP
jgi:hypothetical protein